MAAVWNMKAAQQPQCPCDYQWLAGRKDDSKVRKGWEEVPQDSPDSDEKGLAVGAIV